MKSSALAFGQHQPIEALCQPKGLVVDLCPICKLQSNQDEELFVDTIEKKFKCTKGHFITKDEMIFGYPYESLWSDEW